MKRILSQTIKAFISFLLIVCLFGCINSVEHDDTNPVFSYIL